MNISKLNLINFRNYQHAGVEFIEGTNIIYGNNAQGKTNLLEAIFLFCSGRSHRTSVVRDMILNGQDFSKVDINFSDDVRDYKGSLILPATGKKSFTINDVPIKKMSQISEYINCVMFSPEDLGIIKDDPSTRRRFLDMAICQLRPVYLGCLTDYNKSLVQRNNLLKHIKKSGKMQDTLEIWTEKIARLSARIIMFRSEFIKILTPQIYQIHKEITGEDIFVNYMPNFQNDIDISGEHTVYEYIVNRINTNQKRDIELGYTSVGAHRDDFEIYIADKNSRKFGSQGQQRSVVLSLKLAQTEVIKSQKGTYPIILLDDIMSELDESRRLYLAGKIRDKQVIITCTDRESAHVENGNVAYYKVCNSSIKRDL